MKQSYLYNQMVRFYNRSRKKLQSLTAKGKNLRKQDILKRRIARLFDMLSGMQHALKAGAVAMVLTAGMALLQPNAAQAQITFGPRKENPFGLTKIPIASGGPFFSTFVDLNGDGRLDIMSAAAPGDFYYFQNTGTNTAPAFGAPIHYPFGFHVNFTNPHIDFADLDNDGDLDLLIGDWASLGPFQYVQNTGTPTSPAFAAPVVNPFGLTTLGQGVDPAFVDLDNDGDFDLMVGTDTFGPTGGGFKYFQNTGTNSVPAFAPVVTNPFGLISIDGSITPTFADLDSDGDLDILSGNYFGEFSYYQNTGTKTSPAFAAGVYNPFGLTFPGLLIQPQLGDLDNDGDMDLLVTQLDYFNSIWYIENTTCHVATAPTISTPAVNCSLQNNTLTILTGSLKDAAQWVWYSDSCGRNEDASNIVGTGTSIVAAFPATTTLFVRGEGGCAPRPGNCGSVTITVNNPATWYIDLDKDGYGNPVNSILACIKPPGYVANAADCNDNNAAINPGAPEICGNGLDDNCNGNVDDNIVVSTPGFISGPGGVCRNATNQVFSVTPFAGATSYEWIIPNGATGSSTTNSIVLNFSNTYNTGMVAVKAINACSQSDFSVLQVKHFASKPGQPKNIKGKNIGTCTGNEMYSIPAVGFATSYTWIAPANTTIVSGQGTTSIELSFAPGFASGNLSLTASNCMGTSTARTLMLRTKPAVPAAITGPASVCPGEAGVQFSTTELAGVTYNWIVPTGATITNGQGTAAITVTWGSVAGKVQVRASNICGSSGYKIKTVGLLSCAPPITSVEAVEAEKPGETKLEVKLWPNPARDVLMVTLDEFVPNQKLEISLMQADGKVQQAQSLMPTMKGQQVRMDVSRASAGLYLLQVKQNGLSTTMRFLIAR